MQHVACISRDGDDDDGDKRGIPDYWDFAPRTETGDPVQMLLAIGHKTNRGAMWRASRTIVTLGGVFKQTARDAGDVFQVCR